MKNKAIATLFCVLAISFYCCQPKTQEITIHAIPMRYACGNENDDMKVTYVSDTAYNFLLEKDIDPEALDFDFDAYNDKHSKEVITQEYVLTGYVISPSSFGCDGNAPQFKVTGIQCLDGSNLVQFEN